MVGRLGANGMAIAEAYLRRGDFELLWRHGRRGPKKGRKKGVNWKEEVKNKRTGKGKVSAIQTQAGNPGKVDVPS